MATVKGPKTKISQLKDTLLSRNLQDYKAEINDLKDSYLTKKLDDVEATIEWIKNSRFDDSDIKNAKTNLTVEEDVRLHTTEEGLREVIKIVEARDKALADLMKQEYQSARSSVDKYNIDKYTSILETYKQQVATTNDIQLLKVFTEEEKKLEKAERALQNALKSEDESRKLEKSSSRASAFRAERGKIDAKYRNIVKLQKQMYEAMGTTYDIQKRKDTAQVRAGKSYSFFGDIEKRTKRVLPRTKESLKPALTQEESKLAHLKVLEQTQNDISSIKELAAFRKNNSSSQATTDAQKELGKLNSLIIDTETLMDQQHKLITFGYTRYDDKGNAETHEGFALSKNEKRDVDDIVKMLTDKKQMEEAQEGLAKRILGDVTADRSGKSVVYRFKDGTTLNASELKDYVRNLIQAAKQNNGIIKAGNYNAGQKVINLAADYEAFTVDQMKNVIGSVKQENIHMANPSFDIKTINNHTGEETLKKGKVKDIFDYLKEGDDSLLYRSGYNVDTLSKLLIQGYSGEKHTAGSDSADEAKLLAFFEANKTAALKRLKEIEKFIEQEYKSQTGLDIKDANTGNYTEHFKNFHANSVDWISKMIQNDSQLATNPQSKLDISVIPDVDLQRVDQAYQKYSEKKSEIDNSVSTLVNDLKALEGNEIRAGYSKFLKGEVTAEKLARINPNRDKSEFEDRVKLTEQLRDIAYTAASQGILTRFEIVQDSKGMVSIQPVFYREEGYDYNNPNNNKELGRAVFRLLDGNSELIEGVESATLINGYTNDLEDAVVAENNAKYRGLMSLFKKNPELKNTMTQEDLTNIEQKDNRWAAKYTSLTNAVMPGNDVNILDANGNVIGVSEAQKVSAKEKAELEKQVQLGSWVVDNIRHDEEFARAYLQSQGDYKGDVNLLTAKNLDVDEHSMAYIITALEFVAKTAEDAELDAEGYRKWLESTSYSGELEKNIGYKIIADKNLKYLRDKIRKVNQNTGGINTENVSENNVMSGTISTDSSARSAIPTIPSEGERKTRIRKEYNKMYEDVDKAVDKIEGFKEAFQTNYFEDIENDKNLTTSAMVTKVGYLPLEILDEELNDISNGSLGAHEDIRLTSQQFLELNRPRGSEKFTEALDEKTVGALKGLISDLWTEEGEEWVNLKNSFVLQKDLEYNGNIIPAGSVIDAYRQTKDGVKQLRYRQNLKAKSGTKVAGDFDRGELVKGAETKEDLAIFLKEKLKSHYMKKFNLQESDFDGQFKLKEKGNLSDNDYQEFLAYYKVIEDSNVFAPELSSKKQTDIRITPKMVIPMLRNIIGNPNAKEGNGKTRFENLQALEENDILRNFYELVNGSIKFKYKEDLSDYEVTDTDKINYIADTLKRKGLGDLVNVDKQTGAISTKAGITNEDVKFQTGNQLKSVKDLEKYLEDYEDLKDINPASVKQWFFARMNSPLEEWGFVSDLIKSSIQDEVERKVAFKEGLQILNDRGDFAFTSASGSEGAIGEGMDGRINEHAGVKSQFALYNREMENLEWEKEEIIQDIIEETGVSRAEAEERYKKFFNHYLDTLGTVDKVAVEEFNNLNLAARSNDKKFKAEAEREAKNTITIGFGKNIKSHGDYISFNDIRENTLSPANGQSFTSDEYKTNALKTVYGQGRRKILGNSDTRLKFDFSTLTEDQKAKLAAEGFDEEFFVSIEKEVAAEGKNKTRTLKEQQRRFLKIVSHINDILYNEDYEPGKDAEFTKEAWETEMVQAAKSKRKNIFVPAQQSAILNTVAAGKGYDISWINARTAEKLIGYKQNGTKKDFANYITGWENNAGIDYKDILNTQLNISDNGLTPEEYQELVRKKLSKAKLSKLTSIAEQIKKQFMDKAEAEFNFAGQNAGDSNALIGHVSELYNNADFEQVVKGWAQANNLDASNENNLKTSLQQLDPQKLTDLVSALGKKVIAVMFAGQTGRGPFLTEWSNALQEVTINFDETVQDADDLIALTEKDQDAFNADFDGDIINLRRQLALADALERKILQKRIDRRKEFLNRSKSLKANIESQRENGKKLELINHIKEYEGDSAFGTNYDRYTQGVDLSNLSYDELMALNLKINPNEALINSPTGKILASSQFGTNTVLRSSLQGVVHAGKGGVGLANYADEQSRAKFVYYQDKVNQGKYNTTSLAMTLWDEFQTQLGQQTGISSKKFIEHLSEISIDEQGNIQIAPGTSKAIWDELKPEMRAKYNLKDASMIDDKAVAEILSDSMFGDYGYMALQRAKDVLEEKKARGENDASLENFIKEWEDAFVNEDIGKAFKLALGDQGLSRVYKYLDDNRTDVSEYLDQKGDLANKLGMRHLTTPAEGKMKVEDAIDHRFNEEGAAEAEGNVSLEYAKLDEHLVTYEQQLTYIIALLENLNRNGGGGGKGVSVGSDYTPNLIMDEIARSTREKLAAKTPNGERQYEMTTEDLDKIKLVSKWDTKTNTMMHEYFNGNSKIDNLYSASRIGNLLTKRGDPETAALFEKYQKDIYEGKDLVLERIFGPDSEDAFQKWKESDFKFGGGNSGYSLLVKSLVGDYVHDVNDVVIKAIQSGNYTVDELIQDPSKIADLAKESREKWMGLLLKAFGGDEEKLNAYMKRVVGDVNINEANILSTLREEGLANNASNIRTEKSLATRYTLTQNFDEEGNPISGESKDFTLAATFDNLMLKGLENIDNAQAITKEELSRVALTSIDLKEKEGKNLTSADAIEGIIQHLILLNKLEDSTRKNPNSKYTNGELFARDMLSESLGVSKKQLDSFLKSRGTDFNTVYSQMVSNTRSTNTEFLKSEHNRSILVESIPTIKDLNFDLNTPEGRQEFANNIIAYIAERADKTGVKDLDVQSVQEVISGDAIRSADINTAIEATQELYKQKEGLVKSLEEADILGDAESVKILQERINYIDSQIKNWDDRVDELEQAGATDPTNINAYKAQRTQHEGKIQRTRQQGVYGSGYGSNQYMQPSWWQDITRDSKSALATFLGFDAANKVFQGVTNSIKKTIQAAGELDKKIVDLRIATGQTRPEVVGMLKDFNNLAQELGRTTTSVADAANDWLRAGYTGKEATDLITASMYLSTLGMMDATTATKDLISVLKGWKLQSSEVMSVVDKLVTVDWKTVYLYGNM